MFNKLFSLSPIQARDDCNVLGSLCKSRIYFVYRNCRKAFSLPSVHLTHNPKPLCLGTKWVAHTYHYISSGMGSPEKLFELLKVTEKSWWQKQRDNPQHLISHRAKIVSNYTLPLSLQDSNFTRNVLRKLTDMTSKSTCVQGMTELRGTQKHLGSGTQTLSCSRQRNNQR